MDSLMLCWGLAASIRAGETMDCSGCPLATRNASQSSATQEL